MNEPILESRSPDSSFATRLILGLALLLPAVVLYFTFQIAPAIETIRMSFYKVDLLKPNSPFVGSDNYADLFSDPSFAQAAVYTILIVVLRVIIVAVIPPLVGLMVGGQRTQSRTFSRLLLAGIAALIAPIALAVLWPMFTSLIWGRTPSPLSPVPEWMMLGSPTGARTSMMFIDALTSLGIAAAVGGVAFIAVMRGRAVSASNGLAGIGVWLIGIFLTLVSLAQTAELPLMMTQGGPVNSTTTLGYLIYKYAFIFLKFGSAAAVVTPLIVVALVMGFLIWAVLTSFRLRFLFTGPAEPVENAGLLSALSMMGLIFILILSGGLLLWGLALAAANNGFADLPKIVDVGRSFGNGIVGPWTVIWLIQIPVAYLAGLSLGFLRPINRAFSQALFLILLLGAIIPAEALSLRWYMMGRELGMIDTTAMVGFAWITSAFSLIMFKMFFDGAVEKFNAARAAGQRPSDAFVNTVFLPSLGIVALVGAVLCFASLQTLFWSTISVVSEGARGLPTQVLYIRNSYTTQQGPVAALALVHAGISILIFLPVFVLLHVFVLERLAIVAGPPVDPDLLIDGKRKMKRDEVLGQDTSEQTF